MRRWFWLAAAFSAGGCVPSGSSIPDLAVADAGAHVRDLAVPLTCVSSQPAATLYENDCHGSVCFGDQPPPSFF